MEVYNFKCKVITPMFCGGVTGKEAEIRASSIKGLMRFWWRAYNYPLLGYDLQTLREREAQIFGSTEKGLEGKSSFSILVSEDKIQKCKDPLPKDDNLFYKQYISRINREIALNILDYLSFGTYKYENRQNIMIKEYIKVNGEFSIKLIIHNIDDIDDILTSFGLVYYFGGIGAKHRNGFGRFNIIEFPKKEAVKKINSFNTVIEKLKSVKEKRTAQQVEFLSFSSRENNSFIIFKLRQQYNTWQECLGNLGKIYRTTRLSLERPHNFDNRQYVSAPIVDNKKTMSILERKGKPFFLCPREIKTQSGEIKYAGYILYLYSDIYADVADKKVDNNKYRQVCQTFIDNLKKDPALQEVAL